jgi:hypothetical protein
VNVSRRTNQSLWLAFSSGLALAAVLGCGALEISLDGEERFYRERLETLQSMQLSDAGKQSELDAQIAEFEATYGSLPTADEDRRKALSDLATPMRKAVRDWEPMAEAAAAAKAEAMQGEIEVYKQDFRGTWTAPGRTLVIHENDHVEWESKDGGKSKSVNAPITRFAREEFEIGVFGISTTFRIDTPPHDDGGVWKMTIDGVELTRQ